MISYFLIGAGFYVGLACKDPHGFVNANSASLIRGFLLGVVFWPVGLIVQIITIFKDPSHDR